MGRDSLYKYERPKEAEAALRLNVDDYWYVQYHGMKCYARVSALGKYHAKVVILNRNNTVYKELWIRASCCREVAPSPPTQS